MAARSNNDWRAELVESYADLFRPDGDPLAVPGWPAVGDGWRDLLERACARIRAAVLADGGSFRATQIKEKFGTLRFYWQESLSPEARAQIDAAIDLAEARSAVTCEICGERGALRAGGWMQTRCDAHAEGRPPVPVEEGFESLHVDMTLVDGRWRKRFRIYDRGLDRFVEPGRRPRASRNGDSSLKTQIFSDHLRPVRHRSGQSVTVIRGGVRDRSVAARRAARQMRESRSSGSRREHRVRAAPPFRGRRVAPGALRLDFPHITVC